MKRYEITKADLSKYREITAKAINIAKKNVSAEKKKQAEKIIEMVENYLSDSNHFEQKEDFVNAFGAIYYAHGWIDCGARLKIFEVDDDELFTI